MTSDTSFHVAGPPPLPPWNPRYWYSSSLPHGFNTVICRSSVVRNQTIITGSPRMRINDFHKWVWQHCIFKWMNPLGWFALFFADSQRRYSVWRQFLYHHQILHDQDFKHDHQIKVSLEKSSKISREKSRVIFSPSCFQSPTALSVHACVDFDPIIQTRVKSFVKLKFDCYIFCQVSQVSVSKNKIRRNKKPS